MPVELRGRERRAQERERVDRERGRAGGDPLGKAAKADFANKPPPPKDGAAWEPPPGKGSGRRVALDKAIAVARPKELQEIMAKLSAGNLRGPDASVSMAAIEAALRDPKARVTFSKRLGGDHVNGVFLVELSNKLKGIWKPRAHEDMSRLRINLEIDHQGVREAAAYIVDKAIGHFAGVPPAVFRDLEGEPGALLAYADNVTTALGRPVRVDEVYEAIAFLDAIIGNVDRHEGNLLIARNGLLIPIDHGLAFPLVNGFQGDHNFMLDEEVRLRPLHRAALQELMRRRTSLSKQLSGLGIDARAIDAMFHRVQDMLMLGRTTSEWRE